MFVLKFRSEIQGIRALAVIPVVLFHAGFTLFEGGFVGVDIFFVISGYLITSILVNDLTKNQFSLMLFLNKRIARLLPTLSFMIIFTLPFAWFFLLSDEMDDFLKSLISSIFFVSNIYFWNKSKGYFNDIAIEEPMLHTWSLAIEGQFYLLFPIFLFMFWQMKEKKLILLILILAFLSFILCEWGWRNHPNGNFYLAPTRAWEFLIGSLTAFYVKKNGYKSNHILSAIGLVAILVSIFFYDQSTPFPSSYTLLPTIGTVLLIIFADKNTLVSKVLNLKILLFIGLISYSIYIWHQPILAFARLKLNSDLTTDLKIILCMLSIIVGWISWKFVENPFRFNIKNKKNINLVKFLGCGVLIIIFFCIPGIYLDGYKFRVSKDIIKLSDVGLQEPKLSIDCQLHTNNNFNHPIPNCSKFLKKKNNILIIGDSHASYIAPEIQEILYLNDLGSYAVTYGGCPPIPGLSRKDFWNDINNHFCEKFIDTLFSKVENLNVKTIVLIARWSLYVHGKRFNNYEGGRETGKPIFVDTNYSKNILSEMNSVDRMARVLSKYKQGILKYLNDYNVIFVEPIPEVGWNVPRFVSRELLNGNKIKDLSTSLDVYLSRNKKILDIVNEIKNPKFLSIKSKDLFCSKHKRRCYLGDTNIFYMDDDHLSYYGSKKLAKKITEKIL